MELEKIIHEIKTRGLTGYKISEDTGLTQVGIDKILNGTTKKPTKNTLKILNNYLYNSYAKNNEVNEPDIEYTKAPKGKFEKKKNTNDLVPFYNLDFAAGNKLVLVDNNQVTPDYYMDVPEFAGCTAFRAYSDSMERLIKSGSILFGTKLEEWNVHLEYGQIYGIICTDGRRYLKYIKKFKENPFDYFLFESENENYDEFEMPKEYIRSIWLIHGWLNKRT